MSNDNETYVELAAAINQAIAPIYHTEVTPIQYPAQGDFFWYYQNPNQIFNKGTFDYISARVSPGDQPGLASISPAGGYPNAYIEVVSSLVYTLGTADQTTLDTALKSVQKQSRQVQRTYEKTYGKITEAEIEKAQGILGATAIVNALDYIITYMLGYIWSGRQSAQKPPLTYQEMKNAAELLDLLPQMPASGGPVVTEVASYLGKMTSACSLQDQVSQGSWVIQNLKSNTSDPTDKNGGMKTVDPNTGAISTAFQVSYNIPVSLAQIQNQLDDTSRVIRFTIDVSGDSNGGMNVAVDGGVPGKAESVLRFSLGKSFDVNLNTVSGASEQSTVTVEYQGYSMVPIAAQAWQQASENGWFFEDPISTAFANGTQDVTGFKFLTTPGYNLEPIDHGGNFGRLTALLIGNNPTTTINYKNANFLEFQKHWTDNPKGNITLLDVFSFGNSSKGDYTSSLVQGDSNSEFSVVLKPVSSDAAEVGVPQLQQTAQVIGGVIGNAASCLPELANQASGSVSVKNHGGFVARFSVAFQSSGQQETLDSGNFTFGFNKIIQLPADASEILVTVEIEVLVNQWSVVANRKYDTPVTTSFEISGTTLDPTFVQTAGASRAECSV